MLIAIDQKFKRLLLIRFNRHRKQMRLFDDFEFVQVNQFKGITKMRRWFYLLKQKIQRSHFLLNALLIGQCFLAENNQVPILTIHHIINNRPVPSLLDIHNCFFSWMHKSIRKCSLKLKKQNKLRLLVFSWKLIGKLHFYKLIRQIF